MGGFDEKYPWSEFSIKCTLISDTYSAVLEFRMKVTTKSLRTQAREILDCVDRGEPVTITYRGKPRAKLVTIDEECKSTPSASQEFPVFGMWADRLDLDDVPGYVRVLRKGRRHVD